MIIQGDNGKIYGTGWDDEALDVSRFVPMLQGGEVALQEEASRPGPLPGRKSLSGKRNLPRPEWPPGRTLCYRSRRRLKVRILH